MNLVSPIAIFLSHNTASEPHIPSFLNPACQFWVVKMTSFWSLKMSILSKSKAKPRTGLKRISYIKLKKNQRKSFDLNTMLWIVKKPGDQKKKKSLILDKVQVYCRLAPGYQWDKTSPHTSPKGCAEVL